jgi:hypothetical protein
LRYRRKLMESRAAERHRLLKLLETANVKLASVVADVFGGSGRLRRQALIDGTATRWPGRRWRKAVVTIR